MERLLILSCSERKRTEQRLLPAIERYDGPTFRLLRRYLSQTLDDLPIYVLSAEYGLIEGKRSIPYYDRRMTNQRAREVRPQVAATLKRILAPSNHEKEVQRRIFISFGRRYHEAAGDSCEPKLQRHIVTQATGSLGSRLTQMRSWLYGPLLPKQTPAYYRPVKDKVRLRGIEIKSDPSRVMEVVRNAAEQHENVNTTGRGWYVTIGERKVSVKWLVSLLTGLPVSAFHTDEARRVLSQLGIDIHLNVSNQVTQHSKKEAASRRC